MYCYVIFGKSNDNHTRSYLYECPEGLESGDIVKVSAKNSIKIAMIKSIFEMIPKNVSTDLSKIKSVASKSDEMLNEDNSKSFLLALIDEYKDGMITKEELYDIIKHFVSYLEFNALDENFAYIMSQQLPLACLNYIDGSGLDEEKELEFWKELKDIEYKLRYGYSFWEKSKKNFNIDPVEYSDEYLKIELELKRLIRAEIGEGGYRGFCHKYWHTKKRILKNQFGIEWKSPIDLNPKIIFD